MAAPAFFQQLLASPPSSGNSLPINFSSPCPQAGTVTETGTLTGTMGAHDTGAFGANGPIGFSNCKALDVVLQGSLTQVGHMNLANISSSTTVVNPATVTINGTMSFVLSGVTGSLSFNCSGTLTFTPPDFSTAPVLHATGNVTLGYPTGQNSTNAPCAAFSGGLVIAGG